jgi:hypothetical protein
VIQLLLLLVLPTFTAARLAHLLFGEAEPWRRRFAAISLIVPVVYFPILILSTPALLTPWPVIIFHGVLLGALLCIKDPIKARFAESLETPPQSASTFTQPKLQLAGPEAHGRVSLLAAWLVSIPLVLVTVKHVAKLFARGSRFFSDDFAYHGFTVSGWFQSHALQHPLITFAHYYPYNPHVLSFHASLTSPDHQWVWIASLYWILLAVVAFLALGRMVGGSALVTFSTAACLFAVSSSVMWVAEKHSPTDLAGAAALLAAFALAVPRNGAGRRELLAQVLLSGMLCGFAVGSKVTNAIPAGILFIGTFFIHAGSTGEKRWSHALKGTMLFSLGGFSTAFYWYLRNIVLSGNPVFPFRIWKFDGPVKPDRLEPSILWTYISETPFSLKLWSIIFKGLMHWPVPLGFIAYLGLIAGGGLLLFLALRFARERSLKLLAAPMPWLMLAGLAMLAFHLKAPFSASTLGGHQVVPFSRYLMFVFAVGLAGGAWFLAGLTRWRVSQVIVAVITIPFTVLFWGWYRETTNELPVLLMAIVLVAGLLWPLMPWTPVVTGRRPRRRSCIVLLAPPAIVAWVLLAILIRPIYVPGPHPMIDPHPHVVRFEPTRDAIEALPPGSHIAQLSSRLWEHWTLYGKRSQHHPVLLHRDGYALMDLHVAYQLDLTGGGGYRHPRFGVTEPVEPGHPEWLGMYLKTARLDYLIFSGFSFTDDPVWPPHHEIFKSVPGWQLIWTDGFSEIYAPEGKHPPGFILNAPHNLLMEGTRPSADDPPADAESTPGLDGQPSPAPDSLTPDS